MSEDKTNESVGRGQESHSDAASTLALVHAQVSATGKPPLLTPKEVAHRPVRYLISKPAEKKHVEVVTLPDAFEFDALKLLTSTKKKEKWEKLYGYKVQCPCLACYRCVIVRTLEHGHFIDESYHCSITHREVDRWGSCTQAAESQGPMVLVVDSKLRMLSEIDHSGNYKEYPQPQEVPVFAEDMKEGKGIKPNETEGKDKK